MIAAQPHDSLIPPDDEAEPREALPAPPRIFVIEDEESIREAVVEFLDDSGYRAVGASNGRAALERLTGDSEPPPCLILLDLMMPIMDGQSFRERQLQIQSLAAIPVDCSPRTATWSAAAEMPWRRLMKREAERSAAHGTEALPHPRRVAAPPPRCATGCFAA